MVNVRESFWAMVREPQLLINYLRELGIDINEICREEPINMLNCPPSEGDDFRSRFFVVSYIYLRVLGQELRELEGSGVIVEELNELLSDVLTDMRLYNAPPRLMNAVISIIRDILRLRR
ncbi:hypothetical protein [Vulcanisaeta distributa]|uniref:hypothetical protein n=1 Tax=Vulcanisaeta distributa TaxID=164451 RepID=UPI000B1A7F18|nr:hypothetical protein [Vulcanisaeta distributa]